MRSESGSLVPRPILFPHERWGAGGLSHLVPQFLWLYKGNTHICQVFSSLQSTGDHLASGTPSALLGLTPSTDCRAEVSASFTGFWAPVEAVAYPLFILSTLPHTWRARNDKWRARACTKHTGALPTPAPSVPQNGVPHTGGQLCSRRSR